MTDEKTVMMQIKMPASLREQLKWESKRRGISVAGYIRMCVLEKLNEHGVV